MKAKYRVTGITSADTPGTPPGVSPAGGVNVTATFVPPSPGVGVESTVYTWRFADPAAAEFFVVNKIYELTFAPVED